MPSRATILASLTLALVAAPTALASGPPMPAHIKGSVYCGRIYKADFYTIYTYAKGVDCETADTFSNECAAKPGLHGWKVTSVTSRFGFLLRKRTATIDLQIAGGSPPCLEHAEG